MEEIYDVIVAGGGPSGLFCAANTASAGKKVLLLEKKNSCGKKLLITGLSQCNLTQNGDIRNFFLHYGANGKFLKPSLMNFTNSDLISFFNERGLETVVEKNNKVFPKSKKASDVLEVLLLECQKKCVIIRCGEKLISASQIKSSQINSAELPSFSEDDVIFKIKTNAGDYFCRNFVVATGGITYPATGSTGDGYLVAEGFGHKTIDPRPALCAVKISEYEFSDLAGISFEGAKISLFRNNKKVHECFGDVLFTHTGLSGPGILHMSRYIEPEDTIKISFLPEFNIDFFSKNLSEKIALNGKKTIKSVLMEYNLYERFVRKILKLCKIPVDLTCAHLSKESKKRIVTEMCSQEFHVESLSGINEAMVTRGGVSLLEINPKTMESKICRGLFFIGEVLDIDGDTGGYNLQSAFSTGFLAAKKISND